jgi:hypothetical protein
MHNLRNRSAAGVAVAFLLAALGGCEPDIGSQVAAMNKSNIQRLGNMYAAFQNIKGGRGPVDEAEFRTFIKDFDPPKLKMMGIDPTNLDALFTSERDGKTFSLRYKVGGGRGSSDAVVFEQEGKDGKKQVGYTMGKVEDVDDATYVQLLAGEKAPGGSGRPTGRPAGAPTGPPGN